MLLTVVVSFHLRPRSIVGRFIIGDMENRDFVSRSSIGGGLRTTEAPLSTNGPRAVDTKNGKFGDLCVQILLLDQLSLGTLAGH